MTDPLDRVQLHLVASLDELDACRRWLGGRRDFLGFDTESAGLSPYRDRCRMIQIGDLDAGWAFPADGWAGAACELLGRYQGQLVAFNSPYDCQVLQQNFGLRLDWARVHDAQLAGHITDNMAPGGLKSRSAEDLDDPRALKGEKLLHGNMSANGWTWATVPIAHEPYWQYAALDPVLPCYLMARFAPVLARHWPVYEMERAYARICAGMMTAGMMIDVPFIEAKIDSIREYMGRAARTLREQHGIASVNSNDQVGRALERAGIITAEYTPGGQPSISKSTLRMYRGLYPEHAGLIDAISWCRKGESIIGKCLAKFLALRSPGDIVHYSIHSTGAKMTGRSSVTDPPMQTYDRDEPVIRGAWIPRPGYVFVCIDADQIEMRKAAHFSRDPRLIADFIEADRTGSSFFVTMASKIYGEKISKRDPRYTWTKNATYGQLYGAGLEKAAVTAGVTVEQMRPAYQGLQQLYPQLGVMMRRVIREARAMPRPGVQTLSGRWLYGYRGKEYSLVDYKCQGSAAEILKWKGIELDAAGLGQFLRLPMHDEFVMEVPREHAADVLRTAEAILTDRDSFAVPLTWSGSILEERWAKT